MSLADTFDELNIVQRMVEANAELKVVNAALRFQLVLLAHAQKLIREKLPRRMNLKDNLTIGERCAATGGQKIDAIKMVRERWHKEGKSVDSGHGLLEAENLVEAYTKKYYGWTSKPVNL